MLAYLSRKDRLLVATAALLWVLDVVLGTLTLLLLAV